MNADVWINGVHLGRRPFGYVSFAYDVTPHLVDGINVVAVRVDNSRQPNSRWYTGSGIYRHVWLTLTDPLHVGHWGTFVTTPRADSGSADVVVRTRVENEHPGARRGRNGAQISRWKTVTPEAVAMHLRWRLTLTAHTACSLLNSSTIKAMYAILPWCRSPKLLRVKIILLQQGQSPQQLELGDECSRTDCAEFLNFLLRCWCEGRGERASMRTSETKPAQVCYGIESCYAYTANRPFQQPGKGAGSDAIARKQIETFGRVLSARTDTGTHDMAEMGFTLETWHILDESVLGASLLREGAETVHLAAGYSYLATGQLRLNPEHPRS